MKSGKSKLIANPRALFNLLLNYLRTKGVSGNEFFGNSPSYFCLENLSFGNEKSLLLKQYVERNRLCNIVPYNAYGMNFPYLNRGFRDRGQHTEFVANLH